MCKSYAASMLMAVS